MNHTRTRTVASRVLAPAFLLTLAAVIPVTQPAPAEAAQVRSAISASKTGTLFREPFASTRNWSTSKSARLTVVKRGHKSGLAAQLRARRSGTALASVTVKARSTAGSKHVATAWVRSTRGSVPTLLVVREVDRSSGKVLTRRAVKVTAKSGWKRLKVSLTSRKGGSSISVSAKTKQDRRDRVVIDSVVLKRTKVGKGAKKSTPKTPAAKQGGFPTTANTGVPAGVTLSTYNGPMTITKAGTVIDAKKITGQLNIRAKNVVVKRSQVKGRVDVSRSGSLTMSDSFIDAGKAEAGGISYYNYTLKRVEIVNGRLSAHCGGNCHVEDSLLHKQYMLPGSSWHGDGFVTNGGDNMTLVHNTLACDSPSTSTGGCSAAMAAYGDFAPVTNLTARNNLFVESPAGFCLYAGYDTVKPYGKQAKNVKILNNTFERGRNGKCGVYGAATFLGPEGRNGNTFSGNVWSDGKSVQR